MSRFARGETLRWGICFTLALAAHGAAALALIRTPEVTEVGIDQPAVMLELPEALSTNNVPQTDLAPGPTEEETEATPPPPKEEIKPPEQLAEVALPIPEPPKPEPPQEEHHAAAPQATRAPPKAVARWESELAAHIEHFKRYPEAARAQGEQGVARIAFTIDHDGNLLTSHVVRSSGSAMLDRESLDMLARAQPMPKPPEGMKDAELSFEVPVRFNIR